MSDDALQASLRRMRDEGVAGVAIDTFAHYFQRLRDGDAGELPESEIEPVSELPDADDLPDDAQGARDALDRTVIVKLNGGLGTSMGMTGPKSLLEVKDGLTFLDIVVRQILHLRERTGARLPLVLMNSFATRDASLEALSAYPELAVDGVPADFVQSKVPKLHAETLAPVEHRRRSVARVGAAWPWRSLSVAAELRDARSAARGRLRVRVRRERRQPRSGHGRAHPRVVRARADPVRDGGRRPHARRPQGRAPRAPAGRRARAA